MSSLRDIERCFQGVIPAYLATVSPEGTPNVAALSIVHLMGPDKVGLSCQFMRKSLKNIRGNGHAQLLVIDPKTLTEYRLELRYRRMITEGEFYDKMAAHLEGVASQTGMSEVFSLAGVVECDVLSYGSVSDAVTEPSEATDPIEQLERLSAVIQSAPDLDTLLEQTFFAIDEHLGLKHCFLLLTDADEKHLYNVASHGFAQAHFGAEVEVGEGLYGVCARRKVPSRSGSLRRDQLLSDAVTREASLAPKRSLPLPGLPGAESSIAIPLLTGARCLGVLCFQSEEPAAFRDEHERTLTLVARHLSAMIGLLSVQKNEQLEILGRRAAVGSRALATRVKFFESDGSVFVDNNYLIKGVAGRIFATVLATYLEENRDEFSNREIRLDPTLGLPSFKDNLEARLIALRKRLSERDCGIRMEKAGRGRFRLEVGREVFLERLD